MKTTHEIIDETAEFYNLGNRSVNAGDNSLCLYNGPEGRKCAFARMCIDPERLKENYGAKHLLVDSGEVILKPEYRGYDFEFYLDVQVLHDDPDYWTEKGLSMKGKKKVESLKEKWPVN